jgi:N-acetylmuramoyl-L-alanine amidase
LIVAPDTGLAAALCPAVNFEPRRGNRVPSILLLHYTGVETAEKAICWLTCSESRVSCHYAVDDAGRITQMVAESMRAWHAGEASWKGERDINSMSIGIEVHNPGYELGYPDFPEAQIAAVEALCRDIVARHRIRPECVLAHSDVAPTRKKDPGEKFPWDRLARAEVGHWIEPQPVIEAEAGLGVGAAGPAVTDAQLLLRTYGYDVEPTGVIDVRTEFVVTAFQRHFRTRRVDGRLDQSTVATLERLVAALPRAPLVA